MATGWAHSYALWLCRFAIFLLWSLDDGRYALYAVADRLLDDAHRINDYNKSIGHGDRCSRTLTAPRPCRRRQNRAMEKRQAEARERERYQRQTAFAAYRMSGKSSYML